MGRSIQQVVEHVLDHPLTIDDVSDPSGQQPEHRRHPEGLAQLIAGVDQQGVWQLVAGDEALVAAGVIAAHSPHLGAEALQIGMAVAEGAGLHRAARGVVLRIEKQHQGPATELIAAALNAVLIKQSDQRCRIAAG